jgi:predicted extracellular nuclease
MPGKESRFSKTTKMPLFAAFFVSALLIGACSDPGRLEQLSAGACELETTAISSIQGTGELSPMLGQSLSVRGIVTYVDASRGVYIEQAEPDDSGQSSNALFVGSIELASHVSTGDQLVTTGLAVELGDAGDTVTALSDITGFRICGKQPILPLTKVSLPLPPGQQESLEGMRLTFNQELVVTGTYGAERGWLNLGLGGILPVPTEIARPGPDALAQSEKNRNSMVSIQRQPGDTGILPVGTKINRITGVLGHDGNQLRLISDENLKGVVPPQYPVPPPGENEVRVVGLNLHNYFNGDGKGGGFPTQRGAETPAEFAEQRRRLTAAVKYMKPDMVAVMELENDGFDALSAARDFANDLQSASGAEWTAVIPDQGSIGDSVISVGIFYRTDKFEPAGEPGLLQSVEFQNLSRIPLAQVFKEKTSGETFLVVVNHLKSKGSCPDEGRNDNLRDGQGCWNLARTEAAKAMSLWTNKLAMTGSQGRALVLGDMNAYRMEDPIVSIIESGFKDLMASGPVGREYSFIYGGQAGTLDYAFASEELIPFVRSARILNINSPYPLGVELPQAWLGSSDHDPVLVDLRFSHSSTPD